MRQHANRRRGRSDDARGKVGGPVRRVGVLRGARLRILRRHSRIQPARRVSAQAHGEPSLFVDASAGMNMSPAPARRCARTDAYRSVARWPRVPSSAVRLTRIRVSGSICTGQRQAGCPDERVRRARLTQLLRRRVAAAGARQHLTVGQLLGSGHEAAGGAALGELRLP